MAYQIPRNAFRYMDDATFRSGPSVSPAYGTSRSKDPRIAPHSVYSPAHRAEYNRGAGQVSSYGMAYEHQHQRRSPYESHNEMYVSSGPAQRHMPGAGGGLDMISRTNHEAALSNSTPYHLSPSTILHPLLCSDGRYPPGFSRSRKMEELYEMSESQIEQILAEYGLPGGSSRFSHDLYGRESSRARKLASLGRLLEVLGAGRLAEAVRSRGMGQQIESRRGESLMALQY